MKNTAIQVCYALFILFTFNSTELLAQHSKLSPYTRLFYQEAMTYKAAIYKDANSKTKAFQKLKEEYPVRSDEKRGEYIHGLMEVVQEQLDYDALRKAGVKIAIVRDNIWLFTIPIDKIPELEKVKGIAYVDIDQYLEPTLDEALSSAKVTDVHSPPIESTLPQAYTGEGITVALVDQGFDYTHPTFRDENGDLRIKEVWDMMDNGVGNPPMLESLPDFVPSDLVEDLAQGVWLSNSSEILNKKHSSQWSEMQSFSHGTHVGGIAGGRGGTIESNAKYRGVAYDSELLLINSNLTYSQVVYALQYFSEYAEISNKRVVVNLSFGSHSGPHDGTLPINKVLDSYIENENLIIIGAAGNEGESNRHLSYSFSSTETIGILIEDKEDEESDLEKIDGYIDLWGTEKFTEFKASVKIISYDSDGNEIILDETPFISVLDESTPYTFPFTSISFINTPISNINEKPNMTINIYFNDLNPFTDKRVKLEIISLNNTIHGWGVEGIFFSNTPQSNQLISGDSDFTVSSTIGGTKKVITVGAYSTNTVFSNTDGTTISYPDQFNSIAPFSSKGPTVDNITKPEICAPGNVIISSVNSFDFAYNSITLTTCELVEDCNTLPIPCSACNIVDEYSNSEGTWKYAAMRGTSQAAPIVTGIVALMLEANKDINADLAKCILTSTAQTDAFTGIIPPEGSNTWGWGKVDAHAAVTKALNPIEVPENLNVTEILITQADIEWQDNSTCEANFVIEVSENDNANYQERELVELDVSNFTLKNLTANTTYYVRVKAKNGEVETGYTNEISFTTFPISIPPSNLSTTIVMNNSIQLDWLDNSDNEIGFYIWRSIGDDQHFEFLDEVLPNVTTYIDPNLPKNTPVYYFIKAVPIEGDLVDSSNIAFEIISTNTSPLSSITDIEAFFDTDPGFGNGIPLAFVPSNNVSIDEILDISSLNNGVHILYIRAMDSNNQWSLTNSRLFIKQSSSTGTEVADIVLIEAFFDTDPGFGNGIPLAFVPADNVSIDEILDTDNLPNGVHTLYIRAKDEYGNWSLTNSRLFVKNTNYQPQTANLVELEYFFDEDPGFDNGTKIPLPLKEKVNIAFLAENAGLEDGEYLFSLRAKDEFGRYSLVQMNTITIDNSLTFYTVGATVLHDNGEGTTTLITGANIIFEGGGGCLTNINGQCEISLPEGWEGEINATALGYVFNGLIANEPEEPLNSDIDIILTMEKDPNYNPCEMDLAVTISYPVNYPESAIGSHIEVNGKINNDFYAQAAKSVLLTEGFDSQSNNVIIIEIEDCLTGEGSLMVEHVLKQEVAKNENSIALNSNEIEANISPNPSKGLVNIQFTIEKETPVSLYIFDMNGRKIANLIEGDIRTPNKYQLLFDGSYLKKGAFYCRLETRNCFKTMQFVVQ